MINQVALTVNCQTGPPDPALNKISLRYAEYCISVYLVS
jgi:hypothetical protein